MNMPAPLRLFRLLFVACLLSRFKPVTEDKVAMEGNEGTAETKFNITSSKPSLTSATAVVVVVTETQYANTHFLIAAIIWVCHSESIYTVCKRGCYAVCLCYTDHENIRTYSACEKICLFYRHVCVCTCSIELYTQSTCAFIIGPCSCTYLRISSSYWYLSVLTTPLSFCVSCREEFQARREEAKMLRQKSQEHPPSPCSLLRDEHETKYTGWVMYAHTNMHVDST